MHFSKRYLVGLLLVAMGAMLPSPASAASNVTQVTSGLDSPRGIAFLDGRMVVAEAGHGGHQCFEPQPGFKICIGATSQISWVNTKTHMHTPLVKGLFSLMLGQEGTIGVSGLTVSDGKLLAQIGGTPQEIPPSIAIGQKEAGIMISVNPDGGWEKVAPVGATDFNFTLKFKQPTPGVYSPGTQEHDSNPYGVLATDDGALVADAGSNTLDRIGEDGKITILHWFGWRDKNPNNFPSDAVPTCVARADGALWIAQLSGRLVRMSGDDRQELSWPVPRDSSGKPLLTHVTNCVSGNDGNIYFVNMFGPGIPFVDPSFFVGNVVKYNVRTGHGSVLAGNLSFPNMAAIGPDGNLYVTTNSICPAAGGPPPCAGGGKVLRINLGNE
jgi:hypothetical protein